MHTTDEKNLPAPLNLLKKKKRAFVKVVVEDGEYDDMPTFSVCNDNGDEIGGTVWGPLSEGGMR